MHIGAILPTRTTGVCFYRNAPTPHDAHETIRTEPTRSILHKINVENCGGCKLIPSSSRYRCGAVFNQFLQNRTVQISSTTIYTAILLQDSAYTKTAPRFGVQIEKPWFCPGGELSHCMWKTAVLGASADAHAAELARNLPVGQKIYIDELCLRADLSVDQQWGDCFAVTWLCADQRVGLIGHWCAHGRRKPRETVEYRQTRQNK